MPGVYPLARACHPLAQVPPSAAVRRPRLLPLLAACTLWGCGYGFVRPDQGPVAQLRIGTVEDTSPEGDLGLVVADALRAGLANRDRPKLGAKGPALGGSVRIGAAQPQAYDGRGAGLGALMQGEVAVTLRLAGPDGATYWQGAPHREVARWARAATPIQGRDARQRALRAATRAATADALASFLSLPKGS